MRVKCFTTKTVDHCHFTRAYAAQPIDYLDQLNVVLNLEKANFADQELREQEGSGITKIDKQAHHTSTV